ncbi:MAG: signal peptidase I [Rikenellaceae bacterium]|jgi:signal peptidase I|nr:signal peptidase I [Rikenellaceae bacterium]
MRSKLSSILKNRWFKFSIVGAIYLPWFVVWTGNPWMLIGLPVIYDIYISKLIYRLVWRRHKERKAANRFYRKTMEWVEAIVFATVVATLIRIFLFEMYVIPTSSMEKTLLVGDYLCVSKVAYGPKMPNTPVAFPFVHHSMPLSMRRKSFSEIIRLPYERLAGFGTVQRGDAVVFNFPAGDTVLVEKQDITYYDVLRSYTAHYGELEGRAALRRDYTVISRPVDKRENYIKRCVGLPDDTLQIVNSQLIINGEPFRRIENMQYVYSVQTNGTPLNVTTLQDMGMSLDDILRPDDNGNPINGPTFYVLPLTDINAGKIGRMRNVVAIVKYGAETGNPNIFPSDTAYRWSEDNFGPLWIPRKEATVELTPVTLPLYRRIIEVYEGNKLDVTYDPQFTVTINSTHTQSYTFKMNYYFMMGDNRHNSADSRFWGFVPEDHIVGKASFVWLSLDKDREWFGGKIRWRQMFRRID